MPAPVLRPMLPGDVDRATEMVLGHGWGVRREWLAFAASHDRCVPLVADADGEIVATGVGTANGSAGWVGSISWRPTTAAVGSGEAITQAIIERLDAGGCRTLLLVATNDGRRLYERMGFEVQTQYRILEAVGLPPDGAPARRRRVRAAIRPRRPRGDRRPRPRGTGEDRGHAIARLADADTTRVTHGSDGGIARSSSGAPGRRGDGRALARGGPP